MKLNPFAKKSPGYLVGIKADHARIQKELADKTSALQTARDELADRQQRLGRRRSPLPRIGTPAPKQKLHCTARSKLGKCKSARWNTPCAICNVNWASSRASSMHPQI